MQNTAYSIYRRNIRQVVLTDNAGPPQFELPAPLEGSALEALGELVEVLETDF